MTVSNLFHKNKDVTIYPEFSYECTKKPTYCVIYNLLWLYIQPRITKTYTLHMWGDECRYLDILPPATSIWLLIIPLKPVVLFLSPFLAEWFTFISPWPSVASHTADPWVSELEGIMEITVSQVEDTFFQSVRVTWVIEHSFIPPHTLLSFLLDLRDKEDFSNLVVHPE